MSPGTVCEQFYYQSALLCSVCWQCYAQAAVKHSDMTFSELINYIQKKRTDVRQMIKAHEKKEIAQISNHKLELDQEISKLEQENDKLKLILYTEDHIHFFQVYKYNIKKVF